MTLGVKTKNVLSLNGSILRVENSELMSYVMSVFCLDFDNFVFIGVNYSEFSVSFFLWHYDFQCKDGCRHCSVLCTTGL